MASRTIWFCGWCSRGPMTSVETGCNFCFRRKDAYATSHSVGESGKKNIGKSTQKKPMKRIQKSHDEDLQSTQPPDSDSHYDSEYLMDSIELSESEDDTESPYLTTSIERKFHTCIEARDTSATNDLSWVKGGLPTIPNAFSDQVATLESVQAMIHPQVGNEASTTPVSLEQASHPPILQSPRAYYEKLGSLKFEVYKNSGLASLLKWNKTGQPSPYPVDVDQQNQQIQGWPAKSDGSLLFPSDLPSGSRAPHDPERERRLCAYFQSTTLVRELNIYRNIALAAYSNIMRMQSFGFLQNQISILAIDNSRSSVAYLVPIFIENIRNLTDIFHAAVVFSKSKSDYLLVEIMINLTRSCNDMLLSLHLSSCPAWIDVMDYYSTEAACSICWCNTVRLLDIAVLAYVGAHSDPFLGKLLGFSMDEEPSQRTVYSQFLPAIQLHRRPLKCLSPLLGDAQAWIFALQDHISDGELYVSTVAEVFADIWGPMWKVHNEGNSSILHYNVGSGSIVPWDSRTGQHPRLNDNERMGHWMPSSNFSDTAAKKKESPWLASQKPPKNPFRDADNSESEPEDSDSSESEPDNQEEDSDVNTGTHGRWTVYAEAHPFNGNERLLIGAQANPKLIWNQCRCSTHIFTHGLKENQQLHFLEASKLFHYVDTRNISMVGGSHGLTLGANITIKSQNGRFWKEVLLEAWENQPDIRNPQFLEGFWGVTVSLCTRNARRVRLTELLGTDSVRNLLRPFGWSNHHIRDAFYSAVSCTDPFALRPLWHREEWREELGRVLLTVLRALCQTGYDANREEFYALWMSSRSRWPKRVVLKPSDHSWVRLLRNSEDSCAMAVVVKKCLGIVSDAKGLQICRTEGGWTAASRLETAIAVNHKVQSLPLALEKTQVCEQNFEAWRTADYQWKTSWDVSNFKQGDSFWMGSWGRLRTIQNLSRSHLLLEWDRVKRKMIFGVVGLEFGTNRDSHWEYTDDEDRPPVRPIPVHIQAGS